MPSHTYLLKSRHGTYYFRAVLPDGVRQSLGRRSRDVRVSLRTKDRAIAKRLIARKAYLMTKFFDETLPWEIDADKSYARKLVTP